jgi:uncharacterized protein (TIGR02231 family)
MKKIRNIALLLLIAAIAVGTAAIQLQAAPQAQAAETGQGAAAAPGSLVAKSAIKSVTVFPERATIVREADLKLDPSVKSVVFEGLPATLIPSSLRVTGKGTAAVKILGLDVASMYLESALLPEIKKIQAEIDALEAEAAEIKARLDVLATQEQFLKSIEASSAAKASQDIAAGRVDTAAWERVVDFLGAKLQAVKKGGLDEQAKLKDRSARIDALKKKLAAMKPQRAQEARRVSVSIETGQPGSFAMALSYAVTEARWQPVYTLRALPDAGEVELQMTALVRQRSGENWTGVKALLSTASPALKADPSELVPWYLDFAVPRRARMAEMKAESVVGGVVGGVVGDVEAAPAEALPAPPPAVPLQEAELSTAGVVEEGLHLNFEIVRPVDIPSDGSPHKIPIDTRKLAAAFDYIAVPKLREAAYLRGGVKNTLAFPILAGPADLFILQDFVGSTNLGRVAVGEEAKTFFGEDGQIKVEYEEVKREKSGAGFLGGKTEKLRIVTRIAVQNLRKEAATVEVRDQIPVSRNEKIEVKDVALTPAPGKKDEKGQVTWILNLAPGEKRDIRIDFIIEYPRDAPVVGI